MDELVRLLGPSFGSLAVVILVAFVREWVIPGATHQRELKAEEARTALERARADKWEALALRGTALAEESLYTADRVREAKATGRKP